MNRYVLYLDESETFTSSNDRFFSVAGVIIEDKVLTAITSDLNNLKNQLWTSDPFASDYIYCETFHS